jgi:thiol:disulfide interchange protein DsbA
MIFRTPLSLLFAALLIALSACESPAPEQTPEAAPLPAEEAPAAEAATPPDAPTAESLASVEETVEVEVEADAEATIELSDAPTVVAATDDVAWKYSEGSHFRRMTTSQGTSSAPDKIEVAEVFWYGCPHCYNFDPVVTEWRKSMAADVSFVRIPVIWNPTNQIHARLVYTAQALGIMDQVHEAFFKAIHQEGKTLTKDEEIVEFFAGFGVSEESFREAYGSFGVTSALKRAENLTRRYGIKSVPIIVVNGKYVTEGTDIKTFEEILSITDELVERERREL